MRLPERVGVARAKELMYTSRRITGQQALTLGLVVRACEEERLQTEVKELATEIVENSWGTNRIDKALLRVGADLPRSEALLHERTLPFGVPGDMRERMTRPKKR